LETVGDINNVPDPEVQEGDKAFFLYLSCGMDSGRLELLLLSLLGNDTRMGRMNAENCCLLELPTLGEFD
jgi:hypothetical protein